MGVLYSVLDVAYNIFYPQNIPKAVNNTRGEKIHSDGNLDVVEAAGPHRVTKSPLGRAEIGDVDKRNIIVKCTGKNVEVDIFPDEKVVVLLQEACEMLGKKPNVMCIVLEGKILDTEKRIRDYKLRGGQTVHLIRRSSNTAQS
ncbi:hypothetical protein AALO_G00295770 [Alosa alosa]|uniref:Ubiquitin-like domain-containing protein n=1 Tax=Alosa alosa TaxID=278164 RepID=A0AAV6FDI5_9TELE|nr:hypothetical protein AALO_G00295770 [Alosa alosa]